MNTEKPRIAVLMSTYNGENYLTEQLDSIINQKLKPTDIYIRDDGSTDNTFTILENYSHRYSNIHVNSGRNKGYKASFIDIMRNVPAEYDYYAFSDQDDIWNQDKIYSAVNALNKSNSDAYISALEYVDKNLKRIRIRNYPKKNITIQSIYSRMRYAGCTMVFTKYVFTECKRIIQNDETIESIRIPHDQFVLSVSSLIGKIYVDHISHIQYRRTGNNLTPGGNSINNRIQHEIKEIRTNSHFDILSSIYLNKIKLKKKEMKYLKACIKYKTNIFDELFLIYKTLPATGNLILGFASVIKILLKRF